MDEALWDRIDKAKDDLGVSRSEWLREAARSKLNLGESQ